MGTAFPVQFNALLHWLLPASPSHFFWASDVILMNNKIKKERCDMYARYHRTFPGSKVKTPVSYSFINLSVPVYFFRKNIRIGTPVNLNFCLN